MNEGGEIDLIASDLEDLRRIKHLAILHKRKKYSQVHTPALFTEDDQVISNFNCKVINTCKLGRVPKQITFEEARLLQG
jgi:hypothetical protein